MPPAGAPADDCPCGSTLSAETCCGPLLAGRRQAASAVQLMRSRYTAYVKGDEGYLLATWHPDTRPSHLDFGSEPSPRWAGLTVLSTSAGSAADAEGMVEFVARYKLNGRAQRLHEVSRFRQEGGRWFYLDGKIVQ